MELFSLAVTDVITCKKNVDKFVINLTSKICNNKFNYESENKPQKYCL